MLFYNDYIWWAIIILNNKALIINYRSFIFHQNEKCFHWVISFHSVKMISYLKNINSLCVWSVGSALHPILSFCTFYWEIFELLAIPDLEVTSSCFAALCINYQHSIPLFVIIIKCCIVGTESWSSVQTMTSITLNVF